MDIIIHIYWIYINNLEAYAFIIKIIYDQLLSHNSQYLRDATQKYSVNCNENRLEYAVSDIVK